MAFFFEFMLVQVFALKLQSSGSQTFPSRLISSFRILVFTLSFGVEVDVYKVLSSGNFLVYMIIHFSIVY